MATVAEADPQGAFWAERAARLGDGPAAGSDDVVLKALEVRRIAAACRDGLRVLDAGCGNGWTALALAERFSLAWLHGVDRSEEMLAAARRLMAGRVLRTGDVYWFVADVLALCEWDEVWPQFDLVYTERLLINLPSWEAQQRVLRTLAQLVAPGGALLAVESCADGTERLNVLRAEASLPAIVPPARCRYLRAAEVRRLRLDGFAPPEEDDFTSTYYVLSRVVNAGMARARGEEPAYDAPANRIALEAPGDLFPGCGQTRAWTWRRHGGGDG